VNLKELERKVRVRALEPGDYEAVVAMQKKCFPRMEPWTAEQYASMLERFPDGQIGVEYDGRLVASSSSLIVDFDLYSEWHDWVAISGDGFIRNHNLAGDTLYGIELMVDPEFRNMKLARRLYDARKRLCRERNLRRIIVGGRVPGYAAHAATLSPQEYVDQVVSRAVHDDVLTMQLANEFVLRGLIRDYLPSDEDSGGHATFLEWTNAAYVPDAKRRFQLVENVRVCTVQYQMRPIASFDEFARQCEFFVDSASDYRSDFVVFPELFTTQLLSFLPAKRPAEAARKLAELTPQYLELFRKLAIEYDVNVIGGSQFTLEDDDLYNVSYLFQRDGTIGKQYKIHVTPSERRWWGIAPGRKVEVFDTDRGKIAIQICYDVQFPELARIAARQGAQILFVPYNTEARHGYLRVRLCAQARCIENEIYVVTSGCVGNLPLVANVDVHYAQSGIFTPADVSFSRDGIAAECSANTETIVIHDLDLELLRRHRFQGVTLNWSDRRKDLYRLTFRDGEVEQEV
jgi:predicted amidohydrolase/ribosomal protein S18 acetylase RimI-like enzyme